MGQNAYAVRFSGSLHVPIFFSRSTSIALFLLCRQEISSKAIQVDFSANHPESGWLALIRQFILQQHHSGQTFQLTIQILDG